MLEGLPGSFGPPWIGHTWKFYRDYLGNAIRAYEEFGPVFKSRVLGQVSVGLLGAEANGIVLVEQADKFSNAGGWHTTIGEFFTGGLMLMDGMKHRRHRSILRAAFSRSAIEEYERRIRPIAREHVKLWCAKGTLPIYPAIKRATLDIAARVFLGLELTSDIEKVNRAFLDLVAGTITLVRVRIPGLSYTRALRARRTLEDMFAQLVHERRDDPGEHMLGRLMTATNEEGERLSQSEVVDQMIFAMMAAHDTTTSALTSMFYELGHDDAWRGRARADADARQWALHEALRLHAPLVLLPRRSTESFEYAGYEIPAGTLVAVSPAHTHRMSEYWTDPDTFDPGRFSDARAEHKKVRYSYLPFGAGAHLCLGRVFAQMEAGLIMEEVLRVADWSLPRGYLAPYQQVPIQAPRDGLPIQLERRT